MPCRGWLYGKSTTHVGLLVGRFYRNIVTRSVDPGTLPSADTKTIQKAVLQFKLEMALAGFFWPPNKDAHEIGLYAHKPGEQTCLALYSNTMRHGLKLAAAVCAFLVCCVSSRPATKTGHGNHSKRKLSRVSDLEILALPCQRINERQLPFALLSTDHTHHSSTCLTSRSLQQCDLFQTRRARCIQGPTSRSTTSPMIYGPLSIRPSMTCPSSLICTPEELTF